MNFPKILYMQRECRYWLVPHEVICTHTQQTLSSLVPPYVSIPLWRRFCQHGSLARIEMEKIRLMPTSLPAVINLEEVLTARSSYKTDHFTHFNAREHTSILSWTMIVNKRWRKWDCINSLPIVLGADVKVVQTSFSDAIASPSTYPCQC